MRRRALAVPGVCLLLAGGLPCPPAAAGAQRLTLRHQTFDLPGPPVALIPSDLDGDGRRDLLMVLAYSEWDRISVSRIEDLVEVTTIVPVLYDRREARAWLADAGGAYRPAAPPLPLSSSVLAVEEGPGDLQAVALTDEGIAEFRLENHPTGAVLTLEPLIADPPVLAGVGSFLPGLDFVQDLDGDGVADILLPARDGVAVYRSAGGRPAALPATRISLPGDATSENGLVRRAYPLPRVEDVNGDGLPDLLVADGDGGRVHVLPGRGEGRFGAPVRIHAGCLESGPPPGDAGGGTDSAWTSREFAFIGDLDGDRLAEVVTREEIDSGEGDLKQAKRPHNVYRLYHLRRDLSVDPKPYHQFEAVGHALSGDLPGFSIPEFQDLDGDGRKDLVTVTLDFSVMQAFRILATKRIGIGLEFHVRAQDARGRFHEVPNQGLEETLRLDLNNLKLGRLGQFSGDFDGDGAKEFVHLGRGKTITIHRGGAGCRYPEKPDQSIDLLEEPPELELVRIRDLNGDGRADLSITRPHPARERAEAPTVTLDLYLSGEAP